MLGYRKETMKMVRGRRARLRGSLMLHRQRLVGMFVAAAMLLVVAVGMRRLNGFPVTLTHISALQSEDLRPCHSEKREEGQQELGRGGHGAKLAVGCGKSQCASQTGW